jgi:hypothetical protein
MMALFSDYRQDILRFCGIISWGQGTAGWRSCLSESNPWGEVNTTLNSRVAF